MKTSYHKQKWKQVEMLKKFEENQRLFWFQGFIRHFCINQSSLGQA